MNATWQDRAAVPQNLPSSWWGDVADWVRSFFSRSAGLRYVYRVNYRHGAPDIGYTEEVAHIYTRFPLTSLEEIRLSFPPQLLHEEELRRGRWRKIR